jgi:ABC-type multidrug transport system fused ATPase/permease subunit
MYCSSVLTTFSHFLKNSTIARCARVLSKRERNRVLLIVLVQIGLGLLDLLGVALVGILGSLAITGVSSKQPGNRVGRILEFLSLEDLPLQQQAMYLGLLAALVLVFKTVVSVYFLRRITFFLSLRGALVSSKLVSKLLSQPLTRLQERSMQQTLYSITTGVDSVTMGILNTSVQLCSDGSLLIILAIGLFIVDPTIAFSTFFLFAAVAISIYKLLAIRSQQLGATEALLGIENSEKTLEVLNSYRELVVRNRRSYYARELGNIRVKQSNTLAERAFMPNISKYVIELTLVIGSLLISAVQFLMNDAAHAFAVLSVFLAASTRIAPAVLRMQQGALVIRGNLGSAEPTLLLYEELAMIEPNDDVSDEVQTEHHGFEAKVELRDLSFTYPGKSIPAVQNLNLDISQGKIIAIVGSSGAGKTTLVDLLLGILTPQKGSILVSGKIPLEAISKWPGSIGYVPQDVLVSNGTIHSNVCMGFPVRSSDLKLVTSALEIAQMSNFVATLEMGLESPVGDRGAKLSGGQRQRLGIARAMFTKPLLLILDEATSSLDGETEASVTDAIQRMRGSVTVILIAHRLSTVREADTICYMDSGQLVATGTFEEVRKAVPDFDRQAQLMGL